MDERLMICGYPFMIITSGGYYLIPWEGGDCMHMSSLCEIKMRMGTHPRNEFISRSIGLDCRGASPEFDTLEGLKIFIKWFKEEYEQNKRIILKKEQVLPNQNPTVGF
jgi:hypothetical protein